MLLPVGSSFMYDGGAMAALGPGLKGVGLILKKCLKLPSFLLEIIL